MNTQKYDNLSLLSSPALQQQGIMSVWMCVSRLKNERERQRGQWQMEQSYHAGLPSKDKISQHSRGYQSTSLFNNLDISGHQVHDRCEESKRACGDERGFRRGKTYLI